MGQSLYIGLFVLFLILLIISIVTNGIIFWKGNTMFSGHATSLRFIKVACILMTISYLITTIIFGIYGFKKETVTISKQVTVPVSSVGATSIPVTTAVPATTA